MKIPQLLVQYFYNNRRLALPGIGIFTLDKSIVLPQENDRDLLSLPNGVQFQQASVAAADKDLISYIVQHTGKITPLAISDLESYLNLGMEMLNIGKPFYLEGIGTISKSKTGKLDFTPGEYSIIRVGTAAESTESPKKRRQEAEIPAATLESPQNRNFLKVAAVIAALIIVAWGGYMMYKKMTPPAAAQNNGVVDIHSDTVALASEQPAGGNPDTAITTAAAADSPSTGGAKDSTSYKFIILATDNKAYALRRYHQLISFDLKPKLFQKDSSFFKVYFQFPALARDTIRIKDSLHRQYAHSVLIEP